MIKHKQTSNLDELFDSVESDYVPTDEELEQGELPQTTVVEVVETKEVPTKTEVSPPVTISSDDEYIAEMMLQHRGNLAKVSREPTVPFNAMALRTHLKDNPQIRTRYQTMLTEELQASGVHISERILKMVDLQDAAMGQTIIDMEGNPMDIPADPKMCIELSKEISRLIAEGKNINVSEKQAVLLVSKEDATEILAKFLDS